VNPHPSPLPKGEGIEWNFFLKPHPFVLSPVRGEEKEYISPLIKGVGGFLTISPNFLLLSKGEWLGMRVLLKIPSCLLLLRGECLLLAKFKEFIFLCF
jgi:hypothetical protein